MRLWHLELSIPVPQVSAPMWQVDVRKDELRSIVDFKSGLAVVASGFQFLEGPIWHGEENHLTFSDIVGDTMYRYTPSKGVAVLAVFRTPSHKANGNAHDSTWRIVTCEHATSRVSRLELDGSSTVLASRYGGEELNSPNDVVVRSDGTIFFTDPNFGRQNDRIGVARPQQLQFQGVFRLSPNGRTIRLVASHLGNPNGLCFSADEHRLFVNDSSDGRIWAFTLTPDGDPSSATPWGRVEGAGPGVADGMKIDAAENLYCAGPGGIHVFARDGETLGVIKLPEQTANFTWGDPDMRTLYVTATTSLYRIRTKIPGLPLPRRSAGRHGIAPEAGGHVGV